ncbi:MAG: DUF3147 family protein [Gammaproteobacteria bacterium]|nr:DUF3147 family protein [Gammaproteobacteria bacterium]
MWYYAAKVGLTVTVVVMVSEIAKRSSFWAAVLASLPLASLLAFVWLYLESGSAEKVAGLSQGIFWLVLPSLPFFLLLPVMLRGGWSFWPSLLTACVVTVLLYFGMVRLLARMGIGI